MSNKIIINVNPKNNLWRELFQTYQKQYDKDYLVIKYTDNISYEIHELFDSLYYVIKRQSWNSSTVINSEKICGVDDMWLEVFRGSYNECLKYVKCKTEMCDVEMSNKQ